MMNLPEHIVYKILNYLPIIPKWHRESLGACFLELFIIVKLLEEILFDIYDEINDDI